MIELLDKMIEAAVELAERQGDRDVAHRIARARAALHAPIDPSANDAARRAELEGILRGSKR